MKRRRRGLGSSASTHRRKGDGEAQRTIAYSGDTARAADKGLCARALDYLMHATSAYGSHVAHVQSAETNHNREAAHNLRLAKERYTRSCLR